MGNHMSRPDLSLNCNRIEQVTVSELLDGRYSVCIGRVAFFPAVRLVLRGCRTLQC